MDTKLKLFLDKINLKEEDFKYFNAAKKISSKELSRKSTKKNKPLFSLKR